MAEKYFSLPGRRLLADESHFETDLKCLLNNYDRGDFCSRGTSISYKPEMNEKQTS